MTLRKLVRRTQLVALVAALSTPLWGQESEAELFASSEPETAVTLTFSADLATEHYSDQHLQIGGTLAPSQLGAADLAGSALNGTVTGSAYADKGTLRSKIEITGPVSGVYTATSTATFTDTITVTSPGQAGQAGTLHLDYEIDGRAVGNSSTFAAALSLTLIGEDNFTLTDPFSRSFIDAPNTDFDLTFTSDEPLVASLDIPLVFGEPITYGAALGLTLIGEGMLDFSDTVRFTNAAVSNASDETVVDAFFSSEAGLTYGSLKLIPEPSTAALWLLGMAGLALRRQRQLV